MARNCGTSVPVASRGFVLHKSINIAQTDGTRLVTHRTISSRLLQPLTALIAASLIASAAVVVVAAAAVCALLLPEHRGL